MQRDFHVATLMLVIQPQVCMLRVEDNAMEPPEKQNPLKTEHTLTAKSELRVELTDWLTHSLTHSLTH
jgi:hypothetical protein